MSLFDINVASTGARYVAWIPANRLTIRFQEVVPGLTLKLLDWEKCKEV